MSPLQEVQKHANYGDRIETRVPLGRGVVLTRKGSTVRGASSMLFYNSVGVGVL